MIFTCFLSMCQNNSFQKNILIIFLVKSMFDINCKKKQINHKNVSIFVYDNLEEKNPLPFNN